MTSQRVTEINQKSEHSPKLNAETIHSRYARSIDYQYFHNWNNECQNLISATTCHATMLLYQNRFVK